MLFLAPFVTAAFLTAAPVPPEPERTGLPVAPGRAKVLIVVPGGRDGAGAGTSRQFLVEVEGKLRVDRHAFAARVERILADRRGWRSLGYRFRRVKAGAVAFRIALASPALTNRLCYPLQTNGIFSCYQRGRIVLNVARWKNGAMSYDGDLRRYRIYMVNHEVGHALGYGHGSCSRPGARAPVMMQQTKGVSPCVPWPWP